MTSESRTYQGSGNNSTITIKSLAEALHAKRMAKNEIDARVLRGRVEWELENTDLLVAQHEAANELIGADQELRQLGLSLFAETGQKRPGVGVEIRMVAKLDYLPSAALVWAKEHGTALLLDKKAFEKAAKIQGIVDGVILTISQEPTAYIDTDLAKALEADE